MSKYPHYESVHIMQAYPFACNVWCGQFDKRPQEFLRQCLKADDEENVFSVGKRQWWAVEMWYKKMVAGQELETEQRM